MKHNSITTIESNVTFNFKIRRLLLPIIGITKKKKKALKGAYL